MKEILYLQDMPVYIASVEVSDVVWNEIVKWKYFEKDSIGKQLTRAVDSIAANIAEAFGRYHYADKVKFYYYARGSLYESQFWIKQANKRSLVSDAISVKILQTLNEIAKELNKLIKGIKCLKDKV